VATPVLSTGEGLVFSPSGFSLATALYEVGMHALLTQVYLISTEIPGLFLQSCFQASCLPACTAAWGCCIPAHLNDGKGAELPSM